MSSLETIFRNNKSFFFLFIVVISTFFGLIMVLSSKPLTFYWFTKQFFFVIIGFSALLFFATTDYNTLKTIAYPLMWLTLFLLLFVLFFEIRKTRRWIVLPFGTFQPAEFAKFSMVLFIARYISERGKMLFKHVLFLVCVIFVVSLLITLQPDFGTGVFIAMVGFIMLFSSGVKLKYIFGLAILISVVMCRILFLEGYRVNRVKSWLYRAGIIRNLEKDFKIDEHGYQLKQSIEAIKSGGIFGKGLGKGVYKLYFLPAIHTDFIFSMISEETGLIGAMAVIFAYLALGFLGYKICVGVNDIFGKLLVCGFVIGILFQAFINISMCCGVLPVKGIPLPFFSYGGSSLVCTLSACGVCLNVSTRMR